MSIFFKGKIKTENRFLSLFKNFNYLACYLLLIGRYLPEMTQDVVL